MLFIRKNKEFEFAEDPVEALREGSAEAFKIL